MHYVNSSTKIETYHTLAYCSFDFTPNYTNMINIFHKYSVNQYTADFQNEYKEWYYIKTNFQCIGYEIYSWSTCKLN